MSREFEECLASCGSGGAGPTASVVLREVRSIPRGRDYEATRLSALRLYSRRRVNRGNRRPNWYGVPGFPQRPNIKT